MWIHGGCGTPEYNAYSAAKTLCTNPKNPRWMRYGGRGIEFRFSSFGSFLEHLGRSPAGKVLDRLNREGHFEIGNVYWRSKRRKKRRTRPVNIFAETPTIKKVVLWLTVRHPEGAVNSYAMFRADEGLAWLEMHEALRPGDAVIAVTPAPSSFLLSRPTVNLTWARRLKKFNRWAEESKAQPHKRPVS